MNHSSKETIMATDYSVTITNHSSHSNYFMIFQDDPGSFDSNAMALAWFSKYSNPGPNITVKFTWTVDWGFSWADTGTLSPGIVFDASDKVPISTGNNKITLDYNGAYQFTNQQAGADPNLFYIAETTNIPIKSSASVGITMSGSTVYAAQARPNTNITATPHPKYYLAYGNYQEGEVIDISSVNNPLPLNYPAGVYSLSTTLNANDSWSGPTTIAEHNMVFLRAREEHGEEFRERFDRELSWTDDFEV
jgi:hypothetical protein